MGDKGKARSPIMVRAGNKSCEIRISFAFEFRLKNIFVFVPGSSKDPRLSLLRITPCFSKDKKKSHELGILKKVRGAR